MKMIFLSFKNISQILLPASYIKIKLIFYCIKCYENIHKNFVIFMHAINYNDFNF